MHCAFYTLLFSISEVLSFPISANQGSMIAFLSQYSGFSTPLIAGLRAIAVIVGIAATFLSPPLIRRIGSERAGIWFLSWQTIFLVPVVVAMFLPLSPRLQGAVLVGFVSISRLGLWGFDLSEQFLVQQVLSRFVLADERKLILVSVASSLRPRRHCNHSLMCCSFCQRFSLRIRICLNFLS